MTAISCDNIKLAFGVDTVLDGVSFSLSDGDKMGIVGVNGAGKTTLFRIITGEYSYDEGNIFISKDKVVGILDQNPDFEDDRTLLEEMLLTFSALIKEEEELERLRLAADAGDESAAKIYASTHDHFTRSGGYEFRGRCRGMLIRMGFDEKFHDLKISSLSGGQKTKLALARLLLREPDIMMLDEPTNHLDMETLFWLEDYLRNYRKTVLVISHDRYFLDRITNKILEIENKKGKLYNGNYTAYVRQKKEDREAQLKAYNLQQKEIKRIEDIIEQQRRWGREHNFITIKSKQKQIEHMEKIDRPENLPDSIRFRFTKSGESGNDVLIVKKLGKGYTNKPLFKNFDILVKKNEHVFITGSNGCGKSTLMKIIAGLIPPDDGIVEYGYNVKVGYYDQENQQLNDNKTVIDELWDEYDNLTQTEIRNALALFLFKGDDILKKVGVLSGGEKARLTLAKLIISPMNLLILDEPTNHLDINSREVLESALLEFDGTILAVSHDRYFIQKLATRILAFNTPDIGNIYDYRGGWDEYLEYKNVYLTPEAEANSAPVQTDAKRAYIENKKTMAEQRKLERRIRMVNEEIKTSEAELDRIAEEINGEAATDYERLTELYSRQEELETRLLELYEEQESFTRIE